LSLQINNNIIGQSTKMGVAKESKGNTAGSHQRHTYGNDQELLLEEEDTPNPFKINVKVADKTNDNSTTSIAVEDGVSDPFVLKPVKLAPNSDNLNKDADCREDYDINNGNMLIPRSLKDDKLNEPKKNFNAEEIELIKK